MRDVEAVIARMARIPAKNISGSEVAQLKEFGSRMKNAVFGQDHAIDALARAIKKSGLPDLIICGERATDGDTGQVGPGLASFLDLPVVTYVRRVRNVTAEGLRLERLVEGGSEVLWTPLPAVLTVVKEIACPRLPTLRGKQRARRAELPVWRPTDIGARAEWLGLKGSPTRVVKIEKPQVARQGELLPAQDPADIERAATRLVEFLQEHHFVARRE